MVLRNPASGGTSNKPRRERMESADSIASIDRTSRNNDSAVGTENDEK